MPKDILCKNWSNIRKKKREILALTQQFIDIWRLNENSINIPRKLNEILEFIKNS